VDSQGCWSQTLNALSHTLPSQTLSDHVTLINNTEVAGTSHTPDDDEDELAEGTQWRAGRHEHVAVGRYFCCGQHKANSSNSLETQRGLGPSLCTNQGKAVW
jgi:hypothetical protein